MAAQEQEETELKIPNVDLEQVRHRLEGEPSARRLSPPCLESNTLFDTAEGVLRSRGNALRVREFGGRWLVTFKGEPRYQGAIKVREELESEVQDGKMLQRILGRVGFSPQVSYEKIRETWQFEGVVVTLDHTPIGDFVELEGLSEGLARIATRLGLDPDTGIRDSYLSLWRTHRERHPELGLPADMRFEE